MWDTMEKNNEVLMISTDLNGCFVLEALWKYKALVHASQTSTKKYNKNIKASIYFYVHKIKDTNSLL